METKKEYINKYGHIFEQSIEDYKNGTLDRYYAGKDFDFYKKVEDPEMWDRCPICGLRPKIWEFDNGRFTMCACSDKEDPYNEYKHFSIRAESIMSVAKHSENGMSVVDYDCDGLRKNWNKWARTGRIVFDAEKEYKENGKW